MKNDNLLLVFNAFLIVCMIGMTTSCKMYSTGQTLLSSKEQIQFESIHNSKVKVRVRNYSSTHAYALYDGHQVTILPATPYSFSLKNGKNLVLYNTNVEDIRIQATCLLLFNNKVNVVRNKTTF
ncbi:hypothetical protein BWI97_25565 [Siphonobacter sp. BAB-5405]|nr:hypothetical protein BWI97_25565 [Siphonobacter sp. BAB-5405]